MVKVKLDSSMFTNNMPNSWNNMPMHVLCCKEDGFVTIRNNEVKDIVVTFLLEVSKDVKVDLMKLKGEEQQLNAKKKTQDDVRLDIVEEYSGSGVKQYF